MERNSRKYFTGTVVSDKMDKTLVVSVDTFVKFMETRPLSKTKFYTLVEIVKVKETI